MSHDGNHDTPAEGVDLNRRHILTVATSLAGAAGVAALAYPFLASMNPSERARAEGAPVEVPIGKLEPGEQVKVVWRGKSVSVVKRTPEMLELMKQVQGDLLDPESKQPQQPAYAANEFRSRKPEVLVLITNCTHLGCSPKYTPEAVPQEFEPKWKGGFYCPCHGSKFDLAGRVYRNVPAPLNLVVPPYRFANDDLIVVGEDEETRG
jgi:ubiquinol-cytochrome c reductase iron-sulfur subunit